MDLVKKNWALLILVGILITSFLFSLWLYQVKAGGFYSLQGDDETRALLTYSLYKNYRLPAESETHYWEGHGIFRHSLWLPFQFWAGALLLNIIPDLLWVPFLINSIFSAGVTVMIYLLTKEISGYRGIIPLLACVVYVSSPYFRLINISGLDLSILHFFLIAGVYFWFRFKFQPEKLLFLYLSAIFFLLGSMVRYEGWFFVFGFEVILLGEIWRNPDKKRKFQIALIMLIPIFFILVWSVHQLVNYNCLNFITYYRNQAASGRDQIHGERNIFFKIALYPDIMVRSSPWIVCLFLVSLIRVKKWLLRPFSYFGIVLASFLILVLSAVFAGTPISYERIVYSYILFLIPPAICGIFSLLEASLRRKTAYLITALIFLGISVLGLSKIPGRFSNAIPEEIIRVGHVMKWVVANKAVSGEEKIALEHTHNKPECRPWGLWNTIKLALFAPDHAVLGPCCHPGRSLSWYKKSQLERRGMVAVVAWSETAKDTLSKAYVPVFSTEHFTLFIHPSKTKLMIGWEEHLKDRAH